MTWFHDAVVYQIYPRSFADSDGDGIGDLRGIIGRLDHLSHLGVDVVWLSPVYPSPQADNGYDISDYTDVDPVFGSLADLDELLAALHDRGIKLVMDLVVNHTSDSHPWFAASRSSRDDPRRDWYWWRPPGPGGGPPNGWSSYFSGPAWTLDEATGEYYLHLFSPRQPDLNWENPEVRRAVHAMMRWWLDRGVDGFRMDVINLISKDPALPEDQSSSITGPRMHEFLAELHREVLDRYDRPLLTVGEMPFVTVEQARLFTDPARREVDMVFQFEHMWLDQGPGGKFDVRPLHLPDLKASLGRWQAGLADVGWNSLYWDNHDQPRIVSRWGDDGRYRERSATALATVLHLHRGTPYVYQGEELGMTNAPFAGIEDFQDIESLNHYHLAVAAGEPPERVLDGLRARSRDNARTPMQWDAGPQAGFTTGAPWLPVNPNHVEINAAAQRDDPDSVLSWYRRLIALRHTEPAVADGDFTMLLPDDECAYAFTRRLGDVELLVLGNISDRTVTAAVPDAEAWAAAEVVLANCPPTPGAAITLSPWEARVLRRRRDG
jgi:oligo-1,6-glucosidase